MAVVAAASAGATYVLGQVIDQAYVNKNVAGIAALSGVTVLLLFIKGIGTYGHTVILSKSRTPFSPIISGSCLPS